MKVVFFTLFICSGGFASLTETGALPPPDAGALPPPVAAPAPTRHFVSAIQFAVHEPTLPLVMRSQRLVKEKFVQSISGFPELAHVPYDVRVAGDEVVFYMMTASDMRALMQQAVAMMIQNLNGRVRAKGRTSFYRTELPQPFGGYLETEVNDARSGVVSVAAQNVPLRDLLAQLRDQLGGLSYLIPGECAERKVDWNFAGPRTEAKPVDVLMKELGALYHLRVDKRNNTHIFTGECDQPAPSLMVVRQARPLGPFAAAPIAFPDEAEAPQFVRQVNFPVPPIAR